MKGRCLVALALLAMVAAENKFTTKYDNIELDEILSSDRLVQNYINCLLDKGRCTADAAELKRNLPDALQNDCSQCSEKQKTGADKVIRHLLDHKPDEWQLLESKYDPEAIYRRKYQHLL